MGSGFHGGAQVCTHKAFRGTLPSSGGKEHRCIASCCPGVAVCASPRRMSPTALKKTLFRCTSRGVFVHFSQSESECLWSILVLLPWISGSCAEPQRANFFTSLFPCASLRRTNYLGCSLTCPLFPSVAAWTGAQQRWSLPGSLSRAPLRLDTRS